MSVQSRNLSIDLIKVIAMFLVMTLHVPLAVRPDAILAAGGCIAGIAIPLFFMVSGFLLIGKSKSWKYSFRKILSIIRFVAVITVSFFCIECIKKNEFSWLALFQSMIDPFLQQGIFSVFWYLGAVAFLYLVLPLINKLILKYSKIILLQLGIILFGIEAFIFTLNVLFDFEYINVIQTFRIWNWLFYFILGGIIYSYDTWKLNLPMWIIMLLIIMYVAYGYVTISHIHAVEYLFSSPLCIIFSFCVFCYCYKMKIENVYIKNSIKFLSKLFLPVYAFHIVVIIFILKRIPQDVFGIFRPEVFLLCTYIISILGSWCIMNIPYVNRIFKL